MKTKLFLFVLLIVASCQKPIALTAPKYKKESAIDFSVLPRFGYEADTVRYTIDSIKYEIRYYSAYSETETSDILNSENNTYFIEMTTKPIELQDNILVWQSAYIHIDSAKNIKGIIIRKIADYRAAAMR